MNNNGEHVIIDMKKLVFYWTVVLIPLGYGIVSTFIKSMPLFQ